MAEEQVATEDQAEDSDKTQSEPTKRSFIVNKDNPPMYAQESQEKKSGKKLFIIIVILILLFAGGYLAIKFRVASSVRSVIQPTPVPTSMPVPTPAPTNQPALNRSDWSLEILNGSGVTGAAKKIADQIRALGYPIVKVGNADKDNYPVSQILARKDLLDQVELVVADLKDIIKIASVGGELKEGTASARIIIGKD